MSLVGGVAMLGVVGGWLFFRGDEAGGDRGAENTNKEKKKAQSQTKLSIWSQPKTLLVAGSMEKEEYCYIPPSSSSSLSTPQATCQVALAVPWYPFILLGGERHCENKGC